MAELFPDDPNLSRFASRYSSESFDPTAIRPIVSPATQMRPRTIMQSIEPPQTSVQNSPRPQFVQQENSPRPQYLQATNSPKRPFPIEDFESELNRPRKLARGESPLKGAAGRRLDQQKRLQQQGTPTWQSNAAPFVVPRDITFLLSIIPRADLYTSTKFNAEAMVRLLSQTNIPDHNAWRAMQQSQTQVQQYDGMRPPPVDIPRPSSHAAVNYAGQVSDYWAPPIPAPSYSGGSRTSGMVTQERDSYSRQPQPKFQGPHYQANLPPWPEINPSAYGQPDYQGLPPRPESSGGRDNGGRAEGPYLLPASSWYYGPANVNSSGYNYGR